MKKILVVAGLLLIGLLLFGCTGGGQQATAQPTLPPGTTQPTQQMQPSQEAAASEQPTASQHSAFSGLEPTANCEDLRIVTPDDLRQAGFGEGYSFGKITSKDYECLDQQCKVLGKCNDIMYTIKKDEDWRNDIIIYVCTPEGAPGMCKGSAEGGFSQSPPVKQGALNGVNYAIQAFPTSSTLEVYLKPQNDPVFVFGLANTSVEQLESLAQVMINKLTTR